jgi:hypothetical protein
MARKTPRPSQTLPLCGFLLHLTHYAPGWVPKKPQEQPFDPGVAGEIVEELARQGFNALLIGVSDGVRYRSHPEFGRHYSAPMAELEALATHARSLGLEVIPKLNFSRSPINCHNDWMRAPGEQWHTHFEDDYYWRTAFEAIDEVIAACRPARYFHVGMDEDHERSYSQYVEALRVLRAGLRKRHLTMAAWSDSALGYPSGQIYREKSEMAEDLLPRDSVRVLWDYRTVPGAAVRRIRRLGHELWGAPGARDPKQVLGFRRALLRAGGSGMVMTRWVKCSADNRAMLLDLIRTLGPVYCG